MPGWCPEKLVPSQYGTYTSVASCSAGLVTASCESEPMSNVVGFAQPRLEPRLPRLRWRQLAIVPA